MLIGGLQKLTLIDYPGKIACTVFTVGCNFRCPFCHNPELVDAAIFNQKLVTDEQDFFEFLKSRQGMLDGVCITGGEPLLHHDLPEFLKKIKDLGFLIKLDTNGTSPENLAAVMEDGLIDYIAMDIKASIKNKNLYEKTVGVKVNLENIRKSVQIIMQSGLDYEFRTTVVSALHKEKDIVEIAEGIGGAKKYYLQQFRPSEKLLDTAFREVRPYPVETLYQIRDKIKNSFETCEVRG